MYFTLTAIKSQKNSSGKKSQFMSDCSKDKAAVIATVVGFLAIVVLVVCLL